MSEFKWLPPHEVSLHITHNEHKASYENIEEWLLFLDADDDEWASPEERDKAIKEDSLWLVQWYPDTPIGFYRVFASSLDAIKKFFEEEGK